MCSQLKQVMLLIRMTMTMIMKSIAVILIFSHVLLIQNNIAAAQNVINNSPANDYRFFGRESVIQNVNSH